MFPMILFQITEGGAQGGELVQTSLIPMPPSTDLVTLVTGVEPSTPVLLIP